MRFEVSTNIPICSFSLSPLLRLQIYIYIGARMTENKLVIGVDCPRVILYIPHRCRSANANFPSIHFDVN